MTKAIALNSVRHYLNTYMLGLAYMKLVTDEQLKSLKGCTGWFSTGDQSFGLTFDFLSDVSARADYEFQYETMLKRTAIREGTEALKACIIFYNKRGHTVNLDLLNFARVFRNVVSHDSLATLDRWPDELKKRKVQRVTWRNRTVSCDDVGSPLSFHTSEAVTLLHDIIKYLEQLPDLESGQST